MSGRPDPARYVSIGRLAGWLPAGAPGAPAWMGELAAWVGGVVALPEPRLGRGGAVCPFVPAALDHDLLWLADASGVEADPALLARRMHQEADAFLEASRACPARTRVYTSVLVCFPQLQGGDAELLKEVRTRVKPQILARGITCGEFYRANDDRSVRNGEHPVAQSPVPCIALRHATPHDELFLRSQPELYQVYREWMEGNASGR